MSCGLLIAAALFAVDPAVSAPAPDAVVAAVPASVAHEPLFVEIVERAGRLKVIVDGWIAAGASDALPQTDAFADFHGEAVILAELDMQAHVLLRERGADGDLKCILRGISEDLSVRVAGVVDADSDPARASALAELSHLLDDNVAVILAPPTPETAPHLIPGG
jgi:hypothetical protein